MTHQYISPFGLVLLLSGSMERKGLSAHAKDGNATGFKISPKIINPNKKDAHKASILLKNISLIIFIGFLKSQLTFLCFIVGSLDLI